MATAEDYGWMAIAHVYPVKDTRAHLTENCWCNPMHDEEHEIIVHNSADGREAIETGQRKPS